MNELEELEKAIPTVKNATSSKTERVVFHSDAIDQYNEGAALEKKGKGQKETARVQIVADLAEHMAQHGVEDNYLCGDTAIEVTKPKPPADAKAKHWTDAGFDANEVFPVVGSSPKLSWEMVCRAEANHPGIKAEVMDFLKSINERAPGALSIDKTRGLAEGWTKRKLIQGVVDLPEDQREAFLQSIGLPLQVKTSLSTINQIAGRVVVL